MAAFVHKLKGLVALKKGGDRPPSRPNRADSQEPPDELEGLVFAHVISLRISVKTHVRVI
jgi:hypothetical protein